MRILLAVMTMFTLAAAADPLQSRWRVTLKLLAGDDAGAVARQLAATYRGTLLSPVDGTSSTFAIAVSDSSAGLLRADHRVARVERQAEDGPMRASVATNTAAAPMRLGDYAYDGSGNITAIGTDTYVYDGLKRLESANVAARRQDYTYDAFGNILTITTDDDASTRKTVGVNAASNRIDRSEAPHNVFGTYDAAGNMTSYVGVDTFVYDGTGMVKESQVGVGGPHRAYLYSASDERIATLYSAGNNIVKSEWTLRDTGGAVLRRFTKQGTTWTWAEDYIYRGATLLAANTPAGTQHFHLDHLGTPRLITTHGGVEITRHTYLPFGEEAAPSNDPEPRRFTGHEKDDVNLYYMHARYYLPYAGRFLSVDPAIESVRLSIPQTWNRYTYALDSPLKYIDPTGETVYLVTYTTGNEEGDESFRQAAETRGAEIRGRDGYDPLKDTVLVRGVSTKSEFGAAIKEANSLAPTFGEVGSVETFSHSGPLHGPIFPGDPAKDNQFSAAELRNLDINWEPGGSGRFWGCNTSNFAQSFATAQGVPAYGYAGYANFSYNPQYRVFSPSSKKGALHLIQAGGWSNGGLRGAIDKWIFNATAVPMVRKDPRR